MKNKNLNKKNVRLEKYISPIKYDITLRPDLENFTFEGFESIEVDISKSTNLVTLHSKELSIETAEVKINKEKVFSKKITYDEKKELVIFNFPVKIPIGKHKINIVFKGILNDKMRGFYKSSYDYEGKINHLATTQFEATDARRAFPCFDEPSQKSIFNVSLIVPKGKTAISNTLPVSVQEHESGYEIVKFSPTPKMSTYLLAFIIGDFEYIESKTKNGVLVRIYTTLGKKHQANFALDCAVKTLEFYEKYFNIKYPLNTLDMIAIPDFASGAMENWGAVTYRETAILVDQVNSSTANKQWVALVIAHELAHQWFGNLVTMKWWTHLWLNEGFASYIEYLAVDKLFPDWNIWTQFANHDLGVALKLDSLKHTHPIEVEVHHPDEIGEIFDEVSYSKGASVIRMLAEYLGEVNFRDGLRYYLKKHSYKNTETIHLWQAFEKVSKKPVSKLMKNWTGVSGYPIVKASLNKDKLSLTQDRFFSSIFSKLKNKEKSTWEIPISFENKSVQKVLLSKKSESFMLKHPNSPIKVNIGEKGFFRTMYSKELLMRLYEPVANKEILPIDRLGIIRDLFALSESGDISTEIVLEFLTAYKEEDDYTVWLEIAGGLSKLKQLLAKTKSIQNLDRFIIKLFSPIFDKIGWEKIQGEAHTDTLLRSLILTKLGRSKDERVLSKAKYLFNEMQNGLHIDPDLRATLYNLVAIFGDKKDYNTLLERYKKEALHEEKNRIGNALGEFKNTKLLCETINFSISENVRLQDSVSIISSVGSNPDGRSIWLKFIKQNWKTLLNRYGDGGHTLGRLVKAISLSAEKEHLAKFTEFFNKNKAPGAARAIEQVKEKLNSNISWLERDGKNIDKFFKSVIK